MNDILDIEYRSLEGVFRLLIRKKRGIISYQDLILVLENPHEI